MSPEQRLFAYYSGSRRLAADAFGITTEAIRKWLLKGIPLNRAIDVEKRTDGFVTAEEILRHAKKKAA